MPFYTVHHATSLTVKQQDELAEAITQIHSKTFTTPRLFVNVIFEDISNATIYIAGRPKLADVITLQTRTGPSRTQADFEKLIDELRAAWTATVGTAVDRVIIGGGFVAGMEAGFIVPQAGEDKTWVAKNWQAFHDRANAGDEDMKGLLADIKANMG